MDAPRRARALLAAGALVALAGQLPLWSLAVIPSPGRATVHAGIDFYQFRLVPRVVREHAIRDFYSPASRRRIGVISLAHGTRPEASPFERAAAERNAMLYRGSTGVTATPFLYALFGWLQTDDYDRDLLVFRVLSLLAAGGAVLALARRVGFGWPGALACLGVFGFGYEPLHGIVRVSNVNALQLGALVGAVVLAGRRGAGAGALAGAVIALAVAFKPNSVVAALLFALATLRLGKGRGSALVAGAGAGGSLALALPALFFEGPSCWTSWLAHVPGSLSFESDYNRSLAGWLASRTRFDPGPLLLGAGTLAAVVAILRRDPTRESEDPTTLTALAAGLALSLLGFRLAWDHYFVLAIPAAIVALRPGPRASPLAWRYAAAAVAIALLSQNDLVRVPWVSGPAEATLELALGAALLFGMMLGDLARPAALNEPRPARPRRAR